MQPSNQWDDDFLESHVSFKHFLLVMSLCHTFTEKWSRDTSRFKHPKKQTFESHIRLISTQIQSVMGLFFVTDLPDLE